jgi:hypothetical protein
MQATAVQGPGSRVAAAMARRARAGTIDGCTGRCAAPGARRAVTQRLSRPVRGDDAPRPAMYAERNVSVMLVFAMRADVQRSVDVVGVHLEAEQFLHIGAGGGHRGVPAGGELFDPMQPARQLSM